MGRLSWCIRVVYHRGKTQLVYRGCVSQREDSAGVSGLCITDEKFSWCIQGRVSQTEDSAGVYRVVYHSRIEGTSLVECTSERTGSCITDRRLSWCIRVVHHSRMSQGTSLMECARSFTILCPDTLPEEARRETQLLYGGSCIRQWRLRWCSQLHTSRPKVSSTSR